jgi:hypothetical protein
MNEETKNAADTSRLEDERRAREDEAAIAKPGRYDPRAIFFEEGAKLYDPYPKTLHAKAESLQEYWDKTKVEGGELLGEMTEPEYRAFARSTALFLNAQNYSQLALGAQEQARAHRELSFGPGRARIGESWTLSHRSGLIRRFVPTAASLLDVLLGGSR